MSSYLTVHTFGTVRCPLHFGNGQGERRFYLGAVVDDLFLTTGQWEFGAPDFEGPLVRLSCVCAVFTAKKNNVRNNVIGSAL